MPNEPQTFWQIRNWERFQHYRDRQPPWVKLHVRMLDDAELAALPTQARLLAFLLLMVAARTDNRIPDDARVLAGWCAMDARTLRRCIVELSNLQFIERVHVTASQAEMAETGQMELPRASTPLATPAQDASALLASRARSREAEQELKAVSSKGSPTLRPRANGLPSAPLIEKLLDTTRAAGGEIGVIRANLTGTTDADLGRILEAIQTGGNRIRNRPGYAVRMLQQLRAEREEPDL